MTKLLSYKQHKAKSRNYRELALRRTGLLRGTLLDLAEEHEELAEFMKTHTLSPKQQIENCKTFLKYWETVPPKNVVEGLFVWNGCPEKEYSCGTIACAGGWLPAMPEFAAMGVSRSDFNGAPRLKGLRSPFQIAKFLFGEEQVFAQMADSESGTSHEVVTKRFKNQLAKLESQQNVKTAFGLIQASSTNYRSQSC